MEDNMRYFRSCTFLVPTALAALFSVTAAFAAPVPGPAPIEKCDEDPCRIAIAEELYCAEPNWFCNNVTDSVLNAIPAPHAWTPADIDLFIASLRTGDVNGDISDVAYEELRTIIEDGGDINDISAWFVEYFDASGSSFMATGDPGDRISSAVCKQICRRLPGILPSQCKKVCNRVKNTSRVGFKSLCEHMDRHHEEGRELCWQIYCALWPSHC